MNTEEKNRTICLVSCVSMKSTQAKPARDLYLSPWFLKARKYAERNSSVWYILSAEHGLVPPEQVIAPYEKTLNKMGVRDRKHWASKVVSELRNRIQPTYDVIILAGQRYREFLMEDLKILCASILVPLEGKKIGEQLQWLGDHDR